MPPTPAQTKADDRPHLIICTLAAASCLAWAAHLTAGAVALYATHIDPVRHLVAVGVTGLLALAATACAVTAGVGLQMCDSCARHTAQLLDRISSEAAITRAAASADSAAWRTEMAQQLGELRRYVITETGPEAARVAYIQAVDDTYKGVNTVQMAIMNELSPVENAAVGVPVNGHLRPV